MDVNYFLLMRTKYETLIQQLDCILETYREIRDITEQEITSVMPSVMHFYTEERKRVFQLHEECNECIYTLCRHNFVSDSIDIDPEKSVTITYCRFCQLTQK